MTHSKSLTTIVSPTTLTNPTFSTIQDQPYILGLAPQANMFLSLSSCSIVYMTPYSTESEMLLASKFMTWWNKGRSTHQSTLLGLLPSMMEMRLLILSQFGLVSHLALLLLTLPTMSLRPPLYFLWRTESRCQSQTAWGNPAEAFRSSPPLCCQWQKPHYLLLLSSHCCTQYVHYSWREGGWGHGGQYHLL